MKVNYCPDTDSLCIDLSDAEPEQISRASSPSNFRIDSPHRQCEQRRTPSIRGQQDPCFG